METLPQELRSVILSNIDLGTLFNTVLVNQFYDETKRIVGPIVTCYPNGVVQSKTWMDKQGNKRVVHFGENGNKALESWYNKNDISHRLDGPARKKWYQNGQKEYEVWYQNGEKHRLDGPAVEQWYEEGGNKLYEFWMKNDKEHRLDGPASQSWYPNGQPKHQSWYQNNLRIRLDDGPSLILWHSNGEVQLMTN